MGSVMVIISIVGNNREVSFESIYIVRVEIRVKATKRGVKISANIVELWVKRKKRREKKKRGGEVICEDRF